MKTYPFFLEMAVFACVGVGLGCGGGGSNTSPTSPSPSTLFASIYGKGLVVRVLPSLEQHRPKHDQGDDTNDEDLEHLNLLRPDASYSVPPTPGYRVVARPRSSAPSPPCVRS